MQITTIEQFINRLRQQVQLEIQHNWHDITLLNVVNTSNSLARINLEECPIANINEKGYFVFSKGRQVKWLAQKIVIPTALQDYPVSGLTLRLVLTWWAEDARIYINGKLIQQGDLFDSSARVLITDNARSQQEYLITICLVSPNHDIGALMRSHLLYEQKYLPEHTDPGTVADEITVLSKYLAEFEPQHLNTLVTKLDKFSWHNIQDADGFAYDLQQLRSSLLPLAEKIKQRRFNLLGHAHLDMAWLWTTAETKEIAHHTFKSVLSLQQNYPSLIFGHTSPALYQWIENDRPQVFADIQNAVRQNKWELLGGMWIEPETNLVSGESLIRQLIYGQQYYQQKFGNITKVAWLPDSFGFTWQLPQIFKECGIEYFVTGKLHWNDTTKFPHGCFWWESPDGTRLLTLMSPPNVTGVMDTNPITMTNYAIDWETQTGLQDIFWLPGVGDHGGGPTKDMLEVAAKWDKSPFFPEIKFTKAINYLETIFPSRSQFPIWKDELYLELHRGCYTVHANQKKYSRYCERLLYEAELWTTLATLLCKERLDRQPLFSIMNIILQKEGICQGDWRQLIETAWKKVLFNQFHDILPGTSIPEVFTEANQDWDTAIEIGESLLQIALNAIASSIKLPKPPQADAKPIVVFNSLNWQRSEIVTLENAEYKVIDVDGNQMRSQIINDRKLIFLAEDIPSVGYKLFWLCPNRYPDNKPDLKTQPYILENQYLKIVVNLDTGNLDSIFDKKNNKEILSGSGNELQAFEDKGQYWDAWNIDPDYEQKQIHNIELKSIEWLEQGEIRQTIRIIKQLNKSEFIQDYILEAHSNILKIANRIDWQETHIMIKAAFPLNINSNYATYEIPCGTIERSTQPQTAAERAKWEVSALNWADLTDRKINYGVSILNDCKYGYDAKPNQLRLTLLRASVWPDPKSDRGIHNFTYAIYPHVYSWQQAKTVQKGYELNTPLHTVLIDKNIDGQTNNHLPYISQLLNLSADNLILMALKRSTNQELIMRCYEAHGEATNITIKSDLKLQSDRLVNCLEKNEQKIAAEIHPCKITTIKLKTEHK